jgi:hypothetical protein
LKNVRAGEATRLAAEFAEGLDDLRIHHRPAVDGADDPVDADASGRVDRYPCDIDPDDVDDDQGDADSQSGDLGRRLCLCGAQDDDEGGRHDEKIAEPVTGVPRIIEVRRDAEDNQDCTKLQFQKPVVLRGPEGLTLNGLEVGGFIRLHNSRNILRASGDYNTLQYLHISASQAVYVCGKVQC